MKVKKWITVNFCYDQQAKLARNEKWYSTSIVILQLLNSPKSNKKNFEFNYCPDVIHSSFLPLISSSFNV